MNVWRVTYEYTFNSSSGSDRYSQKCMKFNKFVLTEDTSMSSVKNVIVDSLSCQESFEGILCCEWLGRAIGGRAV